MKRRVLAFVLASLVVAPALPTSAAVGPVLGEAPRPDFTWSPATPWGLDTVTFQSLTMSDLPLVSQDWTFETANGTRTASGDSAEMVFGKHGYYLVTLTATDVLLRSAHVTRTVRIENTPPRADFVAEPSPAFRGTPVDFSDRSTDADGDAIVGRMWEFGDGAFASTSGHATHSYDALGVYSVRLTVWDAEGAESSVVQQLRILNRPPVVSATAPTSIIVNESARFLATGFDPDASPGPLSYVWTFSDGAKFAGAEVARTFSSTGNFTAAVRATDGDGGISASTILSFHVASRPPAVAFSWSPTTPLRGESVQFMDLTTSQAPIAERRWTFGDGSTRSDASPTHIYARAGPFEVTLQVTDTAGHVNVTSRTIHVHLAPTARFVAPGGTLGVYEPIAFTDTSVDDGMIVDWSWSFGDGTMQTVRHPTHPGYAAPGTYLVTLTVRDDLGATGSSTRSITVQDRAPVARWTLSTDGAEPTRGVPLQFEGASSFDPDGQPIAHAWDFGDGTPPVSGATVEHTFAQSGWQLVGLTVDDGHQQSLRTEESHRALRIGATSDVAAYLEAELPDGQHAYVWDHPWTIRATIDGMPIPESSFSFNGWGTRVLVERAWWVDGSTLTIRVDSPYQRSPAFASATLHDDAPEIFVPMVLDVPLTATTVVSPGARPGLTEPFFGSSDDVHGTPLYDDPLERPHGTGRVAWGDIAALPNATVRIEARYVGVAAAAPARDDPTGSLLDGGAVGWCEVGESQTDAWGEFAWSFDGTSTCSTNFVAGGVYAPGRWEVRAVVVGPDGREVIGPPAAFHVDPTGGLILAATAGLA